MKNEKLTFIDIFSGMGTIRLGMEQAGHKCVYAIEWDKHKRKIYDVIFGHEPEGRDINDVTTNELPRADVWAFGFPCQDISVAGKQLGFRGHRSSLFFAVMRLIRELKEEDRPKYLLRTLKTFLVLTEGTTFCKPKLNWMKSGMMQSGNFSTLKISEYHKTEKGCSLLDILEERVPEKYFLSEKQAKTLLRKSEI